MPTRVILAFVAGLLTLATRMITAMRDDIAAVTDGAKIVIERENECILLST